MSPPPQKKKYYKSGGESFSDPKQKLEWAMSWVDKGLGVDSYFVLKCRQLTEYLLPTRMAYYLLDTTNVS